MVVFKSDDGRKKTIRDYTSKIAKKHKDILKDSSSSRATDSYEIKGKINMYDGARFFLSKAQIEWLKKYGKLNLDDWRYEFLFDMPYPDFVYVGENATDSNRTSNLEVDQYYYWPKDKKNDK